MLYHLFLNIFLSYSTRVCFHLHLLLLDVWVSQVKYLFPMFDFLLIIHSPGMGYFKSFGAIAFYTMIRSAGSSVEWIYSSLLLQVRHLSRTTYGYFAATFLKLSPFLSIRYTVKMRCLGVYLLLITD